MRTPVLLLLALALTAPAASGADTRFDWEPWRRLPVMHGGRPMPLDTLSRESLRAFGNRSRLEDPATKTELDATAAYLSRFFEWQGWDHAQKDTLLQAPDWRMRYFHFHTADPWDQAPLLRVEFPALRSALSFEEGQKTVSVEALANTHVVDPRTERPIPFPAWGKRLSRLDEDERTDLEHKALELADRLWAYQLARMGQNLKVLPVPDSEDGTWMPISHLLLTTFDETTDPRGHLREAQQALEEARAAYRSEDAERFRLASRAFLAACDVSGRERGAYPAAAAISLEVASNRWVPFRFAWLLMGCAAVVLALRVRYGWKPFYGVGLAGYAAGLLAVAAGFGMRVAISGRAPVTNMYESVLYVGLGVAVFGLLCERFCRRTAVLAVAATVSSLALVLADACPGVLDASIRPLEPVLRSNFWLIAHVMTITLSYAAFALAMGISHVSLGYSLFDLAERPAVASLGQLTRTLLQIGVFLLATGTILGGLWADHSWGRFWGWDPKEVWALIVLLGYLAVLQARSAGWVGQRGLAALSIASFSLVVMAWYGVNFVLGSGLHRYGFGAGGGGYVLAAVVLQLGYVTVCVLRGGWDEDAENQIPPAPASARTTRAA